MSDFDPSPRSSKRRKVATYGSNRTTATSPSLRSSSVLHSLSNAVSGISRRLFEPQNKRASDAPARESSLGATEQIRDRDRDNSFQSSGEVEEGQAGGELTHAAAGTAQPATKRNAALGKEDDFRPARTGKKPVQPTEASAERDGSHRRSSARRLRTAGGSQSPSANVSLKDIRSSSKNKRNSIEQPEAEEVTARSRVTRERSGGEKLLSLPKQVRSSKTDPASRTVPEEPEHEAEIDHTAHAITADQRSSGREKRKPRKYSEDVENLAERLRKQPMGILTPSKRKGNGTRKSVTFQDEEQEVQKQLDFENVTEQSQATERAKPSHKARSSQPKEIVEVGPLHTSPEESLSGDGNPGEELEVGDTTFLDVSPASRTLGDITAFWDSLPEADEDPSLTAVKSKVLVRLTNSTLLPLTNLAIEYAKVHSLLKATITAGEGNSMLVLGARGCGKTNLIETALADVSREHSEDFHVVRLNGFRQTDDKIALREIWRQVGREMQVEEDQTNQASSYADTMASLLHLLSHPEELAEVLEPDAVATTTKSVIFVLEEFDLFATHPRQTLLYNLFDIAQAKKAPIAVIGCSTRVDVTESLEKRVKSRFSHRWVHLSQPKSFQGFEAVIRGALCVEADRDEMLDGSDDSTRKAWNEYMKSIFMPSPPVQALLRRTFYTTNSVATVFSSLYIPIARITSLDHSPNLPAPITPLTPPDSLLQLLPSLPPLHLYLLVSAARLDAIHNVSVVNFNLVYDHYVELASRARLQSSASGALAQGGVTKIWGKEIAKGAWEELGDWEVLVPAALGKGRGDDAPETKMWRVEVTLEEVAACVGDTGAGVNEVLTKWCKEV